MRHPAGRSGPAPPCAGAPGLHRSYAAGCRRRRWHPARGCSPHGRPAPHAPPLRRAARRTPDPGHAGRPVRGSTVRARAPVQLSIPSSSPHPPPMTWGWASPASLRRHSAPRPLLLARSSSAGRAPSSTPSTSWPRPPHRHYHHQHCLAPAPPHAPAAILRACAQARPFGCGARMTPRMQQPRQGAPVSAWRSAPCLALPPLALHAHGVIARQDGLPARLLGLPIALRCSGRSSPAPARR